MTFIKHRILSVVLFILFLKVLEYIPRTIEAKRTQNSVSTSNNIREAIDFLSQAEYKVKLSKRHKNVTLVFGYTKEGTTTLVQWLATDGENLSAEAFKRSGESYIIADERKTHTSPDPTTKFPELVVDERNSSIAFYDFPGFNDSQTVKDELAAKYFIQKVIDHVEYVKIILVMSQPMNRASSIKLMRQVAHFVKNIGKFRDSIAIVVTKVLNCENKEPDIEINDVAKFLQNTRKILKRPADRQIIQLINILLMNEATKYPRIGIFPQPNENGLLSQSNTWLKPYKESIQEIIQRTLKFTPKEDNFNHLELDKNKSFINDLAKEIINMINNTINNIANDIKKFYYHSIGKMHQKIQSISDFKHFLDNDKLKQFKITIEQIYQLNNITSIEHIHSIANLSNIPLYNITEQYSYLEFLKPNIKLLKKKIVPEIITDLNGSYNKLLTFIDHKADEIRDQIASRVNDIQKKIREYYESETKILRYQEGVDELNQTINILNSLIVPNTEEPEYISKFLNKTSEIVHKLHIDEDVRKEINHKIVDCKYMKHSLDYLATFKSLKEYLPSTLFSNPFYNTIEHLKYLQKWYENLSSLYNEHEPSNERVEDILVSSLFNLKHNESKRDEFNHLLYLIARKDKKPCSEQGEYIITDYNVQLSDYFRNNDTLECINGDKVKTIKIFAINTITIDVDLHAQDTQLQVSFIAQKWNIIGKRKIILNGAPADNIQPLEVNNCTSSLEGRNGINGKPGLPGKSAGHFIGIGREFINSNSLTISANGGDGSNGQDGGNGCPGENGKPAELRYFVTAPNNNSQTSEQDFLHDMDSHIFHKLENPTNQNIIIYDIIGTKGGEGGNGGNGGKGGKGGYAGNVKIIHLDNDSFIRKFTKNGNNGSGGKGGDGGIGGKDGDNTRIRYMPGKFAIQQCILPSNTTGLNGTEGKNDFNDEDIVQPMLSNLPTIATIVNQYKKYLAESFNNISHKSNSINDFYRKLSTNYDIRQSYNISHKIQEFNNLEDNLHKIARQDLFSQFYQTLLESIESSPFNNTDDKVVLYLRDTISGRINNLKTNKNSILIVDIYEYLSYVITKIKDIQTSQEKNSQFFAIKSYKCDYIKHNILNRIEKLKNFTTEITNEIVEINKQIDDKINTLVDEIRNLGEVDEKRIELQQILISKIILQIANITQQALGITKDERKNIVTLMLAAVYNSSESSLFSNQQIYKDIINTIKGNKIRNLDNYLHNIYREMSKYEEFIDIRKTINNTLIQLNTRRNYEKLTLDDILMLEKNVTNKLKEYEIKNMWNSTDALNVLKNINRKIQISSVFDIYDKSKQNPNGLDEISKAIADNRSIMRKLEQNVFEIIAILREARADYKKTIDSELLKSSDVSNLRIRHTLRNVRSEIEQLSRSQEYNITSNNLRHYLGKLDEAITTLIIVYDNIEYYKEQEILMNYIATINLQVASGVEADNVDISEGLRKLENSLNSNFIIDQYKLIMNSLKLWVFPLAREYLKRFTLLSNFKSKINFPNSVSDAIAQIHYIYENINLNRITITDFDKYIFKEEFDSSEGSITRPFYTWNNKEHEEDIFDLLNGKSIQLKANILRSPNKKYAIKFNTIGIRFKSKNTTLQSIINEELKKYYIQIIHSGDSYFRYNRDYYKISSGRNYEIVYSYETDYKGEPKSKNSIYDKIKSGIPLLSPYTTWKVKLIPPEQDSNFDTLCSFKNEIDLELVGKGSYMKENIYDLKVEEYYAEQKIDLSNTLD